MRKPKIIIWDIETSLAVLAAFSLRQDYINHENILQDWYMICACWKEYGKKQIHSVSLLDDEKLFAEDHTNDYHVVKTMRDIVADADIIVAHNGDKFDLKKLNARLIYHRMEPLPPIKTVDTLKEARKIAAFTSNRLDYLAKMLGSAGKIKTSGGLWLRVLKGDREAIAEMVKYNKGDIRELEFVYEALKPYMKGHPNVSLMEGKECACPSCGSYGLQRRGTAMTKTRRYARYQCQKCGSWSKGTRAEEIIATVC